MRGRDVQRRRRDRGVPALPLLRHLRSERVELLVPPSVHPRQRFGELRKPAPSPNSLLLNFREFKVPWRSSRPAFTRANASKSCVCLHPKP